MKMSNVSILEANMRENCEKLFGSISIISPPDYAVKVYKTTTYGVFDLIGRALVLLYFLRIKYRFYVVTCFKSTTVKTRTPKNSPFSFACGFSLAEFLHNQKAYVYQHVP
jgi:hypothetical protein